MTTKGIVAIRHLKKEPRFDEFRRCSLELSPELQVNQFHPLRLSSSISLSRPLRLRSSSSSSCKLANTHISTPNGGKTKAPNSGHDQESPLPMLNWNRSIPEPGSRHSDAHRRPSESGAGDVASSESLSSIRSARRGTGAPRTSRTPARKCCNASPQVHWCFCIEPACLVPPVPISPVNDLTLFPICRACPFPYRQKFRSFEPPTPGYFVG